MKYATNGARSTLTATAKKIAGMSFVVDRMHFKGHIDPWCRSNCDPDKLPAMKKVQMYKDTFVPSLPIDTQLLPLITGQQ